jgi:vacuolar protein sorting-associated protein 13A/C
MTSSTECFEVIMEDVSLTLRFNVEFAAIAILLVNCRVFKVIPTSNLSCGSLQIDNELHGMLYCHSPA